MIDAGLAMAEGASGVNPMESLIAPLEGLFAVYSKQVGAENPGEGRLEGAIGVLIGLENADLFKEAIESLIDMALGDALDLTDHNGADVYTLKDQDGAIVDIDGGVAMLPREFVLALGRKVLFEHVNAITQVEEASLAANGAIGPIFDENLGSCFFVCAQIDWLRQVSSLENGSDAPAPSPERAAFLKPFLESHAVANATRTPDGFRFRFQIR